MSVEVETCKVCHRTFTVSYMSTVDNTICKACATKMTRLVDIEDGTWFEMGMLMGIKHWEQFPTEPLRAFRAFCVYRDAYPADMTVREISDATGYGLTIIRYWIKRWKWKERFFEWSKKCDKDTLVEQRTKRTAMNKEQIDTANGLIAKALGRLQNIDMDELTPKETIDWLQAANKMKRDAINDDDKVVNATLDNKQNTMSVEKKKIANTDDDKKLQEVLSILASAGAINIQTNTSITTPKLVQGDTQVIDANEE